MPAEPEEDALYGRALQEITTLVDQMASARAATLATRQVREDDLIPRPSPGEPTAEEIMRYVLGAIRASGKNGVGTFAGAHNVALRAFRDLGVRGADEYALWRRTRAEVDAAPNPEQAREGAGRHSCAPPPRTSFPERLRQVGPDGAYTPEHLAAIASRLERDDRQRRWSPGIDSTNSEQAG